MNTRSTPNAPLQVLTQTRCFKGLDTQVLAALIETATEQVVPAGEALFRPGDPYGDVVYVLLDGEMFMRRADGTEKCVDTGDFIGLANYLDNAPRASAAIAITEARVLEIKADRLRQLEREYPAMFNLLNQVIAFKLRKRSPERGISSSSLAQTVASVMKSPVTCCGPQLTLHQAFSMMNERKIGSLAVTDEDDKVLGVLTSMNLAEAALLKNADPHESIARAACQTPYTVGPETPLWKAEEIQHQFNVKYLVVVESGKPIGMLSQSDILRSLISQHSTLTTQIPEANSVKELVEFYKQIPEIAAELRESHRRPSAAVRYLSETHLAIQRRTVELTLDRIEKRGYGQPPRKFAVLNMGSAGRKEMLLAPDQDNGIIVQDGPDSGNKEVKKWFERFSRRMNKNLGRVGYLICPGEIMARNPLFHKTLTQWKQQITHITENPTEKSARWANIVFDFDTLYGDDPLTVELRHHALSEFGKKQRLLRMMTEHDAEGRPAIGFFNRLITTTRNKKGARIDLKRNGLRLIVDAARIFALQNGVAAQNTTDRLAALVRLGKLSDDFSTSVSEAYEELLDLLLLHQIHQVQRGEALDKLIDPEQLTAQSRSTLRMAMRAVKRFQERLKDEFGADIF